MCWVLKRAWHDPHKPEPSTRAITLTTMKERIRINLRETSNDTHANVTIEIEGQVNDEEDMDGLEQIAKQRTYDLFDTISDHAETLSMEDEVGDDWEGTI